jgi:hypothetical protein
MRIPRPFRKMTERRRAAALHRAGIPAANERARQETRTGTVETGGDWGDGRWERTRWERGKPVRTYRGTRAQSRLPSAPLARNVRGR